MNRPRNRQPRPPRRGPPTSTVPSTALVVPGAPVFIVLKADQPTGRETRGVVQDVLTAGNHPRGIKVRLRDGQVGRVQRMDGGPGSGSGSGSVVQTPTAQGSTGQAGAAIAYTDVREDGFLEGPPERNLADYFVGLPANASGRGGGAGTGRGIGDGEGGPARIGGGGDAAVCPICEAFEGDEAAVTHHVEREHLE